MPTVNDINKKIETGKVNVLTAFEAKKIISEKGLSFFYETTDVVTCALFEMNVNSYVYLSFGQTDPLIYFSDVLINNIPACVVGPTDIILSTTAISKDNPEYGGAHVIEDLVKGKPVHIKASGKGYEVFQNKDFESWFNLNDLNQARLFLNQGINQNSIVATNSGEHNIYTQMGLLIAKLENSTFNSSSFLNPLINDPFCRTIGIGSKIWIAGNVGYIIGSGSNHNPKQKRNEKNIPIGPAVTLSTVVEIKNINPVWVRGGYLPSYGPVLYVGIGVPVPVTDIEMAKYLSVNDTDIDTTIVDFSIPRRTKPTFGKCKYSELRTSTVIINKKPTLSAPLSSMAGAVEICNSLKEEIISGRFLLSEYVYPIDLNTEIKKLDAKLS